MLGENRYSVLFKVSNYRHGAGQFCWAIIRLRQLLAWYCTSSTFDEVSAGFSGVLTGGRATYLIGALRHSCARSGAPPTCPRRDGVPEPTNKTDYEGRTTLSNCSPDRIMAVGITSNRHTADEEARAEVDVLNSRLEKTAQLTKKIQACLGRLDATGKSVGDVAGPLNGETKKLQVLNSSR